jgi:hypothetical protein
MKTKPNILNFYQNQYSKFSPHLQQYHHPTGPIDNVIEMGKFVMKGTSRKKYTFQEVRKNNLINFNSTPNFNQIIELIVQIEHYQ